MNYVPYRIDLNSVRDDNLVPTIASMPYPCPDDTVKAIDEDGETYWAIVESVLPNGLMYLRVGWDTKT